jgi:hypothetical protein
MAPGLVKNASRSAAVFLCGLSLSCGTAPPDTEPPPDDPPVMEERCPTSRFQGGSADGHADPFGARAAKQARAARVRSPDWIRQPGDARHAIREGDFVLVNDQVAVYIEAPGHSDGYQPYGGDILAVDRVGADGRPTGSSLFGEMLLTFSRQVVDAQSVTVLNDGSDGKAAVIRSIGQLRDIPFLGVLSGLASEVYDFPAAVDYVLEPGADKIRIRIGLFNTRKTTADLSQLQLVGFFNGSRSQAYTPEAGFASVPSDLGWLGFVNDGASFGFLPLRGGLGFLYDSTGAVVLRAAHDEGYKLAACETKWVDYADLAIAGPELDSLMESVRRAQSQPAWRTVRGEVREDGGAPIPGAWVFLRTADGARKLLSRVRSNEKGEFELHAPPTGQAIKTELLAYQSGYAASAPVALAADATTAQLKLAAHGTIVVRAEDAATKRKLPVRVQVVPQSAVAQLPAHFGVSFEVNGRLIQDFAVTGETRLSVPPGQHRVIVSRGYEWELVEQTVDVAAGKTVEVTASLAHSVDTTNVMCADFHIHSFYSADSSDPVDYKVKGAIADGLDIPVSSEHEYVIDFQPVIQKLGLTQWAFGMPSEEFTTFTWGHFGIIPKYPLPMEPNRGAIDWSSPPAKKPPEIFRTIAELPEKPVLIVNHPSGGGFGAYFSSVGFDRDTATGDAEMWSDQFGAVEVFNDSDLESNRKKSLADWFALLNHGKRVWAVGSSDSHGLRTSPIGYPRTCLTFGHDSPERLTSEAVRDALRSGQATVSGGLYISVTGPGGVGPGGEVKGVPPGPLPFNIVVQSPRWLSASRLEVIVDGETADTVELRESVTMPPQGRRYEATVSVTARSMRPQHWVVFHASTPGTPAKDLAPLHPGRRPFAVSNPIFF